MKHYMSINVNVPEHKAEKRTRVVALRQGIVGGVGPIKKNKTYEIPSCLAERLVSVGVVATCNQAEKATNRKRRKSHDQ